jgi:hypothetical protein
MLVAFRACPRKFFWEYVLNLRPRGRQIDLVAGGAFAAAIEAAYVNYFAVSHDETAAMAAADAAFAASWGDFPQVPDDPRSAKSFARMCEAVHNYFDIYQFDLDHAKPMVRTDGQPTVEFSFSVPLDGPAFPRHPTTGDPFLYTGRFDAFRTIDGLLVAGDEKTSGRAPTKWWSEQWDLRNQFMGYTWAGRRSGYPVSGVLVRGVTVQKTQFQHVEALKLYPDFLLDRFEVQLARDLHRIVQCWHQGYFDYDFGDSCTAFARPCAFAQLCSDPEPERWFGEYEREVWNPLTRSTAPVEDAA